jgi:hypothetical protein
VDCEKDLKEWTSYEFVQVTARLLNSLISDDTDKIDTKGFKETSMAEKYRICIGLSEKLKVNLQHLQGIYGYSNMDTRKMSLSATFSIQALWKYER